MVPVATGSQSGTEKPRHTTILLVDNSAVDRYTYRRFLLRTTLPDSVCQPDVCEIIEAATGGEALAYCQQNMPDVILLDYRLPDMDGLAVLQVLRQQWGQDKLPVIVMTGQSKTDIAVAVLKTGAMDYLDKAAITAERLHRAVTTVVQQVQVARSLQQQQQRQQLIANIALQIRQSLTLAEILQTTVDGVRQILGCDRVAVYQFQPDWSGRIIAESVVDPLFSILGKIVTDASFPTEWIEPYRQGRIRAIDDIDMANLSQCHIDFLTSLQVQANLIVPLLPSDRLWGLMVAHECQAPRHWQAHDIELLAQLSTQVSIAIQQSLLVHQLQAELQERRATEAALQASEASLRAIFEAEPACVKVITAEGVLKSMNPAGLAILEADRLEQVMDQCLYPLVQPSQKDAFIAFTQQVAAGNSGRREVEITGLKGTRRWLETYAVPLPMTGETVPHVLAVTHDITERKRMETALRASEEKLQLLVKYTPAWIAMFDRDMCYITASQQWLDGYHLGPLETVVGRSHYEIFPDIPETWRQIHTRCLAGAIEKHEEDRFVRADGSEQWLRWEIRPWYTVDTLVGGILIFVEDITSRKHAELTLQHLNEELEKRVIERTRELVQTNDRLQQELFERERAERTLQISEARFRSTFEDAAIGMALVAADGMFLRGNAALCQFFGYSPGELQQITFQAITHPDDLEVDLNYVRQTLANEIQTYQLEKRYFHKDGHIIWGLLSVSLVRDQQGEPLYFISQIQDITDRKQAEIALKKELSRSKALYRASFDGIVTLNKQGNVVESSQSFADMLGYSLAEVLTLHVSDWDAQWTKAELIQILQHSTLTDSMFETVHRRKDGSLYDVEISATEVKFEQEALQLCICRDISARKQAEAALRESNRRWRSLLDNVQLIVVELDRQGNIAYANPFFLQLTGFGEAEVTGKNWMETFIPVNHRTTLQITFTDLLEQNFHTHYQNSILTRLGEERMIAWSNTLLRDVAGQAIGTISIGEDITERHNLERMKAEFISMVSHELRTPLTSMQASLSLLVDNIIDPTTPEGQDVVQIASAGVDRLVRLVNDILDLERLEAGKIRLEKRLCNTIDLIAIAIEQMQEMAKQANITLVNAAHPCQLHADSDRILQVLINLLSNAIKFSPPHSTITLTVTTITHPSTPPPTPPYLHFTIHDRGRGIPADKLESIFERFQQVDASDSRAKGGTGLGLAICRSIVQQHGGRIWAESRLGQGSVFHFTLPLQTDDKITKFGTL